MADRTDFYFRQRVTEAELDIAFDLLEKADRNLAADIGVYGIVSGAQPAQHEPVADLTIDLSAPARAYDHLGQRIFFGTRQVVNLSADYAGIPTGVTSSDSERWMAVFLKFDRLLFDPRTDGNSQQVFFRQDESFQIVVRQGAEGAIGSAGRVPLVENELLVCDVLRRAGQTQIVGDDIDTSRRQAFVFAKGNAVEVVSALWKTLKPAENTVQSVFDIVDAELNVHFNHIGRRHSAAGIDFGAHEYIGATSVQSAIASLIDALSATTAGTPGASRIGADAVAGTPNALPASNVNVQLSTLLDLVNSHSGAATGAHSASAIAAQSHSHITGASVQAQLEGIVTALLSKSTSQGATLVGAAAVAGSPNNLPEGTVRSQLNTLLTDINDHHHTSDAHKASAISVADTAEKLSSRNLEGVLAEIIDAFDDDHFRGNETNAGYHRTIRQPKLGSGMVLLWDAKGNGSLDARLRVFADSESVYFVVNANYDSTGAMWKKDATGSWSGGFCFSSHAFTILHNHSTGDAFSSWEQTWKLPMSSTVNSAFETTGAIQEIGRIGFQIANNADSGKQLSTGSAVTFRSRFSMAPSSVTLKTGSRSYNWNTIPDVSLVDRDGFACHSWQYVNPNETAFWYGQYTAIA
ncbi:MAG: hypothetical protein JXR76_14505 [Deltaproteobacteria bacterium]|nr:hypothetical protein [Deltaproteobacteria bacterium]